MADFQGYMLETRDSLEKQDYQVAETLASFESIDESIAGISTQIGQIHNKVEQTRTINSRLAESVHSVAAVAEQTAAGVQEVNASSTQQDQAIGDIARQAEEINEISQRLFREINVFKITGAADKTGTMETTGTAFIAEPKQEEPATDRAAGMLEENTAEKTEAGTGQPLSGVLLVMEEPEKEQSISEERLLVGAK
jgi:methyl-accepting chemotaxis protein